MSHSRQPHEQPLTRRDAEGGERTASSWESLTERLIREAQEAGEFDDLPGTGQTLELDDDSYAGDMAIANHIMRNAGVAPPWIETDKEVRRRHAAIETLLAEIDHDSAHLRARLEQELDGLADAHDDAVSRLESQAPPSRQQRARVDRASLKARLAQALERHRDAR